MGSKFEEIMAFVYVVDHKSFTKAANILGIAKSSLSRRVNNLEKRLGVQLMQRTTRKLFLTQQGEYFYERSLQILAQVDDMENKTSAAQLALRGRIKIAIPLSFSQQYLTKILSQFKKTYPDIDLIVDLNDRQIDLIEDGFDLAIRIGQMKDSSLIAKKLGELYFVTCASPKYLEENGCPMEPLDLKQHKGLYYSHVPDGLLWYYEVNGKSINCAPQKALTANNGVFLAQCAVNDLGVVRSPLFIVKPYLENKSLRVILQDYQQKTDGIYAVFPPGRLIPARIRTLVEHLQQEFDQLGSIQLKKRVG